MYELERTKEFFVGIDSDGCAFDTMELKHKECFIHHTIQYYNLQAISKYAREAAEFVNLYSKSRGINRFPALVESLQWLQKRPELHRHYILVNDLAQSIARDLGKQPHFLRVMTNPSTAPIYPHQRK